MQVLLQHNRGPFRPLHHHPLYLRERAEIFRDCVRVVRCDKDIQIPDRLLSPPDGAREAGLHHCRMIFQFLLKCFCLIKNESQQKPGLSLLLDLDVFQNSSLGLFPESLQFPDLFCLHRVLKVNNSGNAKLFVEDEGFFRTNSLDIH